MKIFENIDNVNQYLKIETLHSLIDIRKFEDIIPLVADRKEEIIFNFYKISFIRNFNGFLQIGDTKFHDNNGVMYFISPRQQYICTSTNPPEGYQILIHPELFQKFFLEKNIDAYSFFSYTINESLLLTKEEEEKVELILNEAWSEFNQKKDQYSLSIVLSYINILFTYCERFYSRQFGSRQKTGNQLTNDFFHLLKHYYDDEKTLNELPSVLFFAKKLDITANYLGDLLKHHTGKSAINIIHEHIIEEAKTILRTTNKPIVEISSILGFEYPTYFSRLFKKKTGITPSNYRKSVNSI